MRAWQESDGMMRVTFSPVWRSGWWARVVGAVVRWWRRL